MISLRYHIVSIASVLLALAVGIVVGSTSISERLLSTVGGERNSLSKQAAVLRSERDELNIKLGASERFGRNVGPLAVRGQLSERSVVLIETWDTRPEDRDALKQLLGASGAHVTGELQLTSSLLDPVRADDLRQVVAGLLPAGVQLPPEAPPGTLVGGLLGPLMQLNPATAQPQATPAELAAALGGLSHSGFATASPGLQPADLALVLTGGDGGAGDAAGERASMLARMAAQIDASGAGTVLAGMSGSAGGHGSVGVARADTAVAPRLSTVDNSDTPAGRIAAVLALREQADQQAGHYGVASSAQAPMPSTRE